MIGRGAGKTFGSVFATLKGRNVSLAHPLTDQTGEVVNATLANSQYVELVVSRIILTIPD